MTTEWMKQHVKPSLVAKYDQEMAKLRGEESSISHVVENIKNLTVEVKKIETDEQRHNKALAEDDEDERHYQERRKRQRKSKHK
jgi:hypothetical protein